MFGKKDDTGTTQSEKLAGPKEIPSVVQSYMQANKILDPDLVRLLKSVVKRKPENGQKAFYIRIFDEADALANKIQIKNYLTLDDHTKLIIYDGWFDEATRKVELVEKNKLSQETQIFSLEEIVQKIEALSTPGNTVFFYMARGPANGGPLGRGAAVVELTPPIESKKVKKYTIYTTDVVDMKPVGKGDKLFNSDKAKEVAKWIKDAHHKRAY